MHVLRHVQPWGLCERGKSEDLAALDANYLRRSDAELFARPASSTPR